MCYGMNCPHEDSWGECRGVPGRDCPEPTVWTAFGEDVDLKGVEDWTNLRGVCLVDDYGNVVHCFYNGETMETDMGEDVELCEDVRGLRVVGVWDAGDDEIWMDWPKIPHCATQDEEDEDEEE